ncbi:hypothetical protein DL89DRAFT_294615 [Linderina pennispora]|uniref:Probable RNA polymerase II nuclear localization protein SLC7A6OS n=1 Tax=Linderina pennispora TaxID=61395 RepID=A0A1Y1W2R7_9FUNG|nr:uncharacterized protein DL89DRAFT_294615 [Linderina pennispora]ORX67434.1 hypothetical protein DL89DRAFT_294615 [Linderina pennispora]
MQYSQPALGGKQSVTILRVKRPRDQQPMGALVIDQHLRKRVASSVDLFGRTTDRPDSRHSTPAPASAPEAQRESAKAQRKILAATGKQPKLRVLGKRRIKLLSDIPQTPHQSEDYGIPQKTSDINMFDAINEDDIMETRPAKPSGSLGTPMDTSEATTKEEAIMEQLLPMVRDYLSFNQTKPEYVYDFYYILKNHPAGLDPNVLRTGNVGSVLWIDDAEEFVNNRESDDGNDDDEDSNAEDYYTNDYPDEPDFNSEVEKFYYSSDERDILHEEESSDDYEDYVW